MYLDTKYKIKADREEQIDDWQVKTILQFEYFKKMYVLYTIL